MRPHQRRWKDAQRALKEAAEARGEVYIADVPAYQHGRPGTYNNRLCRCTPCKAAKAADRKKRASAASFAAAIAALRRAAAARARHVGGVPDPNEPLLVAADYLAQLLEARKRRNRA